MLKRILVVMVVILVLSALFAMTVAAQGTGDPAAGKTAWAQRACKNCHGDNGEGKYAAPLAGTTRTSAEWITQVHTPRANMPAFTTAQISDTVITDMWAYMKTLTKPASFTPVSTTVPAGALPGHQLTVDKRCVACHGDFKAFAKARFVDQNREVTTDAVLKQLRTPAKNMPMFGATQVTDAQAAQIADFIKAQAVAVKAAAVVTPTTPVTTTAAVTATKATTVTAPAAAAPAPATMPKTGAELSASTQATTTKPVTATTPVTPTVMAKDIVDTAVADGRFKTLVAAVQAAGLVDTLKGKGPFTVFAPTDDAFAKLPAGTVEALLKDPAKLKDILLYHVVSGNVTAADAAKLTSANTVQGKPITIKAEGGKIMINDATVVIPDVKTSNGVIHVIDKVILPPAAPAAAAPVTATKAMTATAPAAAAAAPAPATMPKTGGEMGLLVLSGLSMLGISAGLAIRGRRR